MYLTTNALVLKSVLYKESDKILTILSEDLGKLTVSASDCFRTVAGLPAACQPLVWSQFVLYQQQDKWILKEISILKTFKELPKDFYRFSLGCYFAEVCETLSVENSPDNSFLPLILNCLYVLNEKKQIPLPLVKAVFELRIACESGYEPLLDSCSCCHSTELEQPQFALVEGTIHCQTCGGHGISISPATLSALRFIAWAEPKQIFSFSLSDTRDLSFLCEKYLLTQVEQSFKSLQFYRKLSM